MILAHVASVPERVERNWLHEKNLFRAARCCLKAFGYEIFTKKYRA